MTLIITTKENGSKSILNLITSFVSIVTKKVIKPLTVELNKKLRNYNKSTNFIEIETLVQTLFK
jgi:hypothetical protein